MLWAQSTTEDYIRAKNKLQFISYLFIKQIMKRSTSIFWNNSLKSLHSHPQRITSGLNTNFTLSPRCSLHKSIRARHIFFLSLFIFREHSTGEPASSRVSHFILRAYTGTDDSHSQHRKKSGGFGKKTTSKWTKRVEISKEKISGSKRSMYGYILTYSRL